MNAHASTGCALPALRRASLHPRLHSVAPMGAPICRVRALHARGGACRVLSEPCATGCWQPVRCCAECRRMPGATHRLARHCFPRHVPRVAGNPCVVVASSAPPGAGVANAHAPTGCALPALRRASLHPRLHSVAPSGLRGLCRLPPSRRSVRIVCIFVSHEVHSIYMALKRGCSRLSRAPV